MNDRFTVLVAEDDPVFRRVITFSVEAAGFRCMPASNGLEAKAILAVGGIDLLVTDHQMPLCSGLELIQHVRQETGLISLPIILCTAKGFELNASELSTTYRLLAVLRKPFSPRQMMAIVTTHLQENPGGDAAAQRGPDRSYSPLASSSQPDCHA